jgi:hypothetical protein
MAKLKDVPDVRPVGAGRRNESADRTSSKTAREAAARGDQ